MTLHNKINFRQSCPGALVLSFGYEYSFTKELTKTKRIVVWSKFNGRHEHQVEITSHSTRNNKSI